MRISPRRFIRWSLATAGILGVSFALYLSVFVFPYPLFPHHLEHGDFRVYSDAEIPDDFAAVLDDAATRVEAMELFRGERPPRIFYCQSRRLFAFFVKLSGRRHLGQALLISLADNAFLCKDIINSVEKRSSGRPTHTRMRGSTAAAIAHEVAHHQIVAKMGYRAARTIPAWKGEGWADYSANLSAIARDPTYDLRSRIGSLLDDDSWRSPTAVIDRRHYRWQLFVEYQCGEKGFGFEDVMSASLTEEGTFAAMMDWYSTLSTQKRSTIP